MMKRTNFLFALIAVSLLTACSSLPTLPSISMPWSSTPQPDPTADAVFNRGMELFNNKKYVAALDQFTKIKQEFPFAPQALQAELKIAECYYFNQQYPEAITAFKEFQSMHPTNENIPLVIYRLGLAHFDQFSATDRDQKNTEIAKGYFETVMNTYPNSPYAAEAKEKLGKAIGYLADHDFNVAYFYFQQEKYPAARDRFEEMVRRYRGTPIAAKSLFYLGESYRKEKNGVKAALAYESILQHYPQSKFANDAKNELAALEKEKHEPLAMLLMRDRRAGSTAAPQTDTETASAAKLKGVDNLVAKTEVVYEEPGQEKGIFRRVADKLNPFSSSEDGKKSAPERKKPESDAALVDALTKKKTAEKKEDSPGVFASLWNGINPFGSKDSKNKKQINDTKDGQLMAHIDDSLKGQGIDAKNSSQLNPPPAALPEIIEAPVAPPTMDTSKLLGQIDSELKKDGKAVTELPPPPEAAQGFKDAAAAQAMAAKAPVKSESAPSIASTGLLGNIDSKLKSKGVEPADFELPISSADEGGTAPKKEPAKKIELEPKISMEKGALFLGPEDIPAQERATSGDPPTNQQSKGSETSEKAQEPGTREIPKALVRGPNQSRPAPKASSEQKKSTALGEDEEKGALEQLKENAEAVGKFLNPFSW
jgi:outer membrane protein assembly factor BamD